MNILLVRETKGYLMMSLWEKLKIKEYQTIVVPADINAISRVHLPLHAILIYMDEQLSVKQNVLIYLRDKAIEEEVPVFLIGDTNEIRLLQKLFPADVIAHTFSRPLNLVVVCETLDLYLRKQGSKTRKKILVVDHSDAMIRNIENWLGSQYDVIAVNSGVMAMKYLETNRPDLVLLDYEIPDCDGRELLTLIRKEKGLMNLPVMFLTGKDDRESVMKVMALKPARYLLKTMEPQQIIAAVDDFFSKGKRFVL